MHGIPKSSKIGKEIMKTFGEVGIEEGQEIIMTKSAENQEEDESQPTLDRFG